MGPPRIRQWRVFCVTPSKRSLPPAGGARAIESGTVSNASERHAHDGTLEGPYGFEQHLIFGGVSFGQGKHQLPTILTSPSMDVIREKEGLLDSAERVTVKTPDGRQLEAIVSGDVQGLPLVFHNGAPMGLVLLPSFMDPAQYGLRTVIYARPGYAGSSPHSWRTVADAAADTASVLDALGARRFVTLGWSAGGPCALACAALLPERCLAAAVVASQLPFIEAPETFTPEDAELARLRARPADEAEVTKYFEAWTARFTDVRADGMAERFSCPADRQAMTSGEFANWMAASFSTAFVAGIEGVRGDFVASRSAREWGFKVEQARRVAIWNGAEDPMAPVADAVWLDENIPDAELHVLPEEGHVSIALRFPEIFADLIARSQHIDREGT